MGLFTDRNKKIPVWFMRQAGRYHTHYQGFRSQYSFMDLCKIPELAKEVTMGPIEDFKFDAAILFSDLLFPLEYLGMGLSYESGPPTLKMHIKQLEDIQHLQVNQDASKFFKFQSDAIALLKQALPKEKSLLGFVGAPFTLYAYASEGSHKDGLHHSKRGLYDDRFNSFLDKLIPALKIEMEIQAKAGADAVCLFDTAVGELGPEDFETYIIPSLKEICASFKNKFPHTRIVYYSKHTNPFHLKKITSVREIDVLGIDWRNDLNSVLLEFGDRFFIQGNIDPDWLFLPWPVLEKKLQTLWEKLKNNPHKNHLIFGLGHGVLPKTPEENVRRTVEWIHKHMHE